MKAHLIDTHLLVPRSRSSAKVKVIYQGHVSQKMGVSGAFVFHKHILFLKALWGKFCCKQHFRLFLQRLFGTVYINFFLVSHMHGYIQLTKYWYCELLHYLTANIQFCTKHSKGFMTQKKATGENVPPKYNPLLSGSTYILYRLFSRHGNKIHSCCIAEHLTLSQTLNFRLFQTERVCR